MTVEDSTSSRAATIRIPAELAIGAAYRLSPHTRIVSDLRAADWSTSTLQEDASGDDVPRLVGVRDVRSLHVGLERDLSVERGRAAVRTGAFIRRSSAEDIDGAQLSAWGLSIGESWKLKTTVLDIGLLMTRSSRWKRTEDAEARTTLRNFDVILAVGLRGAQQ